MDQKPIFIGGLDRTGKTLLRLALCLHPNILITRRTDLWVKYYNHFGDLSKQSNLENCINAMMDSKHIKALKIDLIRLRNDFSRQQRTYENLFSLINQQLLERENKSRWGDQSEGVERFADPIFEAYPSARIIHIIRDPRDRYSASKQKWTKGKGGVGVGTAKWIYSSKLALRNQKKYPDNYKIIRYEEIVQDPSRAIEEVCDFLGEEFYPSMLLIGHIRGIKEEIVLPELPQQNHFMKNFVGQYRLNLSKLEIGFIQKLVPVYMQSYNYSPAPLQFSVLEKINFWGKYFPRNLGVLFMWLSNQSLRNSPPEMNNHKPKTTLAYPHTKPIHENLRDINND